MDRRQYLSLSLLAVGVSGCTATGEQQPASSTDEGAGDSRAATITEAVYEYHREEREKQGLDALTQTPELEEVARQHSLDMQDNDFHGHESSDGTDAIERIRSTSVCPSDGYALENVGKATDTDRSSADRVARGMVEWWLGSEEHRRNMLDERVERIGVGVAVDPNNGEKVLFTVDYCE